MVFFFFRTERRAFKIQCTQDGTWLPGACVPVTCDPPPSKFHGLYQCSNGFQFNSECRIKCEDDDNQSVSLLSRPSQPIKVCFYLMFPKDFDLGGTKCHNSLELLWDQKQRDGEGKYVIKVEKERGFEELGNIIFMTIVVVLTITHRGLAMSDIVF